MIGDRIGPARPDAARRQYGSRLLETGAAALHQYRSGVDRHDRDGRSRLSGGNRLAGPDQGTGGAGRNRVDEDFDALRRRAATRKRRKAENRQGEFAPHAEPELHELPWPAMYTEFTALKSLCPGLCRARALVPDFGAA